MLIRVRNNFGTFKVTLEDDKDAMLSDVLNDDIFEPWKLVQELSTDPSGRHKVSKELMRFGQMICLLVLMEKNLNLPEGDIDLYHSQF